MAKPALRSIGHAQISDLRASPTVIPLPLVMVPWIHQKLVNSLFPESGQEPVDILFTNYRTFAIRLYNYAVIEFIFMIILQHFCPGFACVLRVSIMNII